MRNVIATVLELAGVVGVVFAVWSVYVPAGVVLGALAVGAVGYLIDPAR